MLSVQATSAAQGITPQINYQAKLLDSGSIPVANGTYQVKFSIYDASSGGNRLWTASGTTATPASIDVSVTSGGLLSLLLGSGTQNSLQTVDWNSDSLYLGVTIGSDSEMTPRKRVGAVAQAFNSQSWNGYRTASSVSSGAEVLKLSQLNTDAASSQRTSLLLTTSGTSNLNDYFLVANNGTSNVFTISRQGHATTTGNLAVSGGTILGDAASDFLVVNAQVAADFVPDGNGTRTLGSTTNRWNAWFGSTTSTLANISTLTATNLTWTNATGTNTTSTNLFANNLLFAGATGTVLNSTNATFTNTTSTSFYATNLLFASASGSTVSSTNMTFSYATGNVLEVTSILTVGGTSVCLQSGTNCPSSSSADLNWVYDNTNDLIRTTTSTSDVAIGGATQSSSPVFFRVNTTSTRVLLGANGSSTDLVIGATTANITNTAFQLDGNDLYVAGNIGSASSVYTNGAFVAGSGTTLYGDGFITKTNGDLNVQSSSNINLVPTGYVGIGTTSPTEKLTVVDNILNTLEDSTSFLQTATTTATNFPMRVQVQGKYAYTVSQATSGNNLQIFDVSDPNTPALIGGVYAGDQPHRLFVAGKYAYAGTLATTHNFKIIDISNPAAPATTTSLTIPTSGSGVYGVAVQGSYAYVVDDGTTNNFRVIDISSTSNPRIIRTLSLGSSITPYELKISGRYAYVIGNTAASNFKIVDIADPQNPSVVSTISAGTSPESLFVRGRYVYELSNQAASNFRVIDVSNPTSPSAVGTITVGSSPRSVFVAGRYAYVADYSGSSNFRVVDVSDPTSPSVVTTRRAGNFPNNFFVAGRYLYSADSATSNNLHIIDVKGIETNGLIAASAELGNMQVLADGVIGTNLAVGGALAVGQGGITSAGEISVTALATSTFLGGVSSTRGEFSQALTVGNVNVCLSNGTNCPSGSATPTLQQVTDQGSITTNGITVYGGITTSNMTATGTASSSRLVWTFATGTHTTTTNLFATNALWSAATGTNLFSTNSVLTSSTSTNLFATNLLFTGATGTNARLTGALSVAGVSSLQNLTFTIATGTSATTTNFYTTYLGFSGATGTNLEVTSSLTVGGTSVCLQSGTNCPVSGAATNYWGFNGTQNLLYPATNTVSVAFGGATESSAPFYFRRNTTSTRLILGGNGSSTDLIIGATTSSGMNSGFQLTGDDLFVAGNIGSASSVFTNGAFVAGLGSTMFGNGFIANTNATLTVSASTTQLNGSFDQVLTTSNASYFDFVRVTSTVTGTDPQNVQVVGRYAYVVDKTANLLEMFDVTDPSMPSSTGSIGTSSTPLEVAVAGRYAYVAASSRLNIFDISSSSQIIPMSSMSFSGSATEEGIHVEGKFAYLAGGSTLTIVDISNPNSPSVVKTVSVGSQLNDVFVRGGFAYLASWNQSPSPYHFFIVDVRDPVNAAIIGRTNVKEGATGDAGPWAVYVQGGYAYVANQFHDTFSIIDVSNPSAPRVRDELTIGDSPYGVQVQGRYAYVAEGGTGAGGNSVAVIDISSSTNAVLVKQISLGTGTTPQDLFVSGRYLYVAQSGNEQLSIWKIPGSEFVSLDAQSAEVGTLQVRSKAWVDNELFVGQGLNVGTGGIMTNGVLAVSGIATSTITGTLSASSIVATSTLFIRATSTNLFATNLLFTGATGTNLEVTSSLTVGGTSVCLQSGTNCPVSGATNYWGFNGTQNLLYPATNTVSVAFGGATESSAPFYFRRNTTSTRLILGGNGSSTDLVIGATTSSGMNSGFQLTGDDLFVAGNIGSASSVYTNGAFVAGTGSTMFGDGFISNTNATLTVSASSTRLNGSFEQVLSSSNSAYFDVALASSTSVVSGVPENVQVQGRYAYVVNSTANTLEIFDVTDPAHPSSTASIGTSSTPGEVAVAGSYAYVAASSRLNVFDVSSSSQPLALSSIALTTGGFEAIHVEGAYVYVVGNSSVLNIVDVSNPNSPSLLKSYSVGSGLRDVVVRGRYAYIASWSQVSGKNFFIVDVLDPFNPVTVGSANSRVVAADAGPWAVYVQGGYAYVANQFSSIFSIIDISNPSAPRTRGDISVGTNPYGVTVQGRYAYVAQRGGSSVGIVDVSSSTLPVLVKTVSLGSAKLPNDIFVSGRYMYVPQGGDGKMSIWKLPGTETISLEAHAAEIGRLDVRSNLAVQGSLTVQGSSVCLANGTGCLWTLASDGTITPNRSLADIRVTGDAEFANNLIVLPTSTTMFTTSTIFSFFGVGYGIKIQGDYAYAAGSGRLAIFDISQPSSTQLLSNVLQMSFCSNCQPDMFYVAGNYVYLITDSDSGSTMLRVIDVSDPRNQKPVGSVDLGNSGLQAIDGAGNYLYTVNRTDNILVSVDISDPTNPRLVSTVSVSSTPRDVRVRNGLAYILSEGTDTIGIFDVSNPSAMRELASTSTSLTQPNSSDPRSLDIQGPYAYVVGRTSSTLSVIDISATTTPRVVSSYTTTNSFPGSVYVSGRYAYIPMGGGSYGVDVVDISTSSTPRRVGFIGTGTSPQDIAIRGRHAFIVEVSGNMRVMDIGAAVETNGLVAHNAEIGELNVRGNENIGGDLVIRGGAYVGRGGLQVDGGFAVISTATSTFGGTLKVSGSGQSAFNGTLHVAGTATSTFLGFVSSTRGEFSQGLSVGGSAVCLRNKAGCPPDALIWSYNNASDTVVTVSSTVDIKIGGSIDNTLIDGDSFRNVSTSTLDADPVAVKAQGQYVYVLKSNGKLQVFRMGVDGTASTTANVTVTSTSVTNMDVQGRYAYIGLTQGTNNLIIVDLLDPTAPTSVGLANDNSFSASGHYVAVRGKYLYMSGGGKFTIFDVTSSTSPYVAGQLTITGGGLELTISGNKAYLGSASNNFDVTIVDISYPSNPALLKELNVPGNGTADVKVVGDLMYTVPHGTISGDALRVWDVSSSTNPIQLGSATIDFQTAATRLYISGKYAYVSDTQDCNASGNRGRIHVFNIASSTRPLRIMQHLVRDASHRVLQMDVKGRYLYAGLQDSGTSCANDGTDGLMVIDINGIETNGLLAHSADLGQVHVRGNSQFNGNVTVDGMFLSRGDFVSLGNFQLGGNLNVGGNITASGTLQITGAITSGNLLPNIHNTYDIGANGTAWKNIYASGTILASGLNQQMKSAWTIATSSADIYSSGLRNPYTVRVHGDYMYVSGYTGNTVGILKAADGEAPVLQSSITMSTTTLALDVSGNYLYAIGYDDRTFKIFDVSNPGDPREMSSSTSFTVLGAIDVRVAGRYAYVSTNSVPGSPGITIIDISDPRKPKQVGRLDSLDSPGRIAIRGSMLYVADNGSFRIIDVSSSTNPVLLASRSCSGNCYSVDVSGHYAFLLHRGAPGRILTFDITRSINPQQVATTTLSVTTSLGANLLARDGIVYWTSGGTAARAGAYRWNPAALSMAFIGEVADATKLTNNDGIDIQGNRLFLTGSNAGETETYLNVIDIGGTTVDSLKAGSALFGSLDVLGDARLDRNLNVLGGVQIGLGGLYSAGDVAISKDLTVSGNISNILTSSSSLIRVGALSFTSASLTSIAVQGNYAYVSDSREHKVYAVDTTDKTSPATVNSLVVGDGSGDIFAAGNYLYLTNTASPTSSLEIVDISNPGAMAVVATTSLANPRSVYVQGKYAYVGGSNLSIVDISLPTGPVVATTTDPNFGTISDVFVQGRYAYLADTTGQQLHIVDVSDPFNPTVASSTFMAANPRTVYVQGRYAYVGGGDGATNQLRVYSVALASFPVLRSTLTLEGRPEKVVVRGRYAYVTDIDNNKITVVDVSDPTNIYVVNRTQMSDQAIAMSVNGRYAYVAGKGSSSLNIYDVTGAEINGLLAHSAEFGALSVLGNGDIYNDLNVGGGITVGLGGIQSSGPVGFSGSVTVKPKNVISSKYTSPSQISMAHIAVRGRYLYALGGSSRLEVVDVQDPQSPIFIATATLTTANDRLAGEQGRYLFAVGAGSSIDVIDTSKPASSTRVHTFTITGVHEDAFVSGRFLYLIDSNNDVVRIVDVSDPFNPVLRGSASLPSCTESDVVAQGHFVYATCRGVSGLLYVIDAENPDSPQTVGSYTPGSAVIDIKVQGGYVYLAKLDDTIDIIDITSSTNPTLKSTISGVEDPAIAVGGKYLFAGSTGLTTKEIRVFDVSKPSSPTLVNTLTLGSSFVGQTASLVLSGRFLYFGEASPGNVRIIDTGGIDTGTLQAGSAELGDLQVLGSGYVQNSLHVDGGFSVGQSAEFHDNVSIHSRVSSTQGILQVHSSCGGSVSARVASFLDDSNHLVSIRCNGQLFADNGTIGSGGDYAEYFMSNDTTLSAGDMVSIEPSSASTVTRGRADLRPYTLGVVSANPVVTGMGILEGHASATLVGLLGQLDTNVNASGTPVSVGDKLMMGAGGVAVKAKGPGMVLGTALESLANGTGTVRVYVSPHWWAGDLFISNDTGSFLVGDLAVASTTIANASTTAVSSPLFSFRGTAYNTSSGQSVTSTFSLWNRMMDASTTRFTVSHNSTSTSLLTLSDMGDLAISGRFYPSDEGTPQFDKYIFYQATGTPGDYMRTNASGWGTGSYDFAEFFPSTEKLGPGDVVVVDPSAPERVKKSTKQGEGAIVGIVSTKPGFLGGEWKEGQHAIALAGRVPTKVSTENGIIRAGDYLVASGQPGVAMRATNPGPTVGIALQDYDGSGTSTTITAYVYVGWWGGSIAGGSSGGSGGTGSAPRSGLAEIASGDKSVQVTFDSLGSYPIVQVTPYGLPTGEYGIRNITDIGFTIVLMQMQTIDLRFAWTAEPSPTNSPTLFKSNGTSASYNPTTGQVMTQADPPQGGSSTSSPP